MTLTDSHTVYTGMRQPQVNYKGVKVNVFKYLEISMYNTY